jgi:hypothetical protein
MLLLQREDEEVSSKISTWSNPRRKEDCALSRQREEERAKPKLVRE